MGLAVLPQEGQKNPGYTAILPVASAVPTTLDFEFDHRLVTVIVDFQAQSFPLLKGKRLI